MKGQMGLIGLLVAWAVVAQEPGAAPREQPAGPSREPAAGEPRGPREFGPGVRPPEFARTPMLFRLFDTNSDGVLDEQEINAAPQVLRKLDRNGDGKIEPRELFEALGPGPGRPGEGRVVPPRPGEGRPPQRPEGSRGTPGEATGSPRAAQP